MQEYINLIDKKLDEYMPVDYPQKIFKAMKYTVTLKGKRLRPIMCLEACRMFGGNIEDAIPTACAIEMLHAQTLIHDDLPCMDDDMYRRGQLTNHMVFGEANAVLAGDALLTFAPQTILKYSQNLSADKLLKIMEEYFHAAGAYGVIAGQVIDIQMETQQQNNSFDTNLTSYRLNDLSSDSEDFEYLTETLNYIHTHKTADLFKLALRTGAIIADATDEQICDITEFGQKMGVAFQIADDILDVTSTFEEMGKTLGKDEKAGKLTYVSLYGLEKARKDLVQKINECFEILKKHNLQSEIFEKILTKIRNT